MSMFSGKLLSKLSQKGRVIYLILNVAYRALWDVYNKSIFIKIFCGILREMLKSAKLSQSLKELTDIDL